MLEILGSVVASIFSGGATGILGIVAQRFFDFKNKQLDIQMETLKFSIMPGVFFIVMNLRTSGWS